MNSRKENETFYQNNGVELSDEALANVVGGCGQSHDYNDWGDDGDDDNGNGGNGYGRGRGRGHGHGHGCHEHGLLGNLVCDLL